MGLPEHSWSCLIAVAIGRCPWVSIAIPARVKSDDAGVNIAWCSQTVPVQQHLQTEENTPTTRSRQMYRLREHITRTGRIGELFTRTGQRGRGTGQLRTLGRRHSLRRHHRRHNSLRILRTCPHSAGKYCDREITLCTKVKRVPVKNN